MKVDSILESSNNQETKVSFDISLVLPYKYSLSYCHQALTNQFLSNIRSRTPVLQYLFVNF